MKENKEQGLSSLLRRLAGIANLHAGNFTDMFMELTIQDEECSEVLKSALVKQSPEIKALLEGVLKDLAKHVYAFADIIDGATADNPDIQQKLKEINFVSGSLLRRLSDYDINSMFSDALQSIQIGRQIDVFVGTQKPPARRAIKNYRKLTKAELAARKMRKVPKTPKKKKKVLKKKNILTAKVVRKK